MSLIIDRYHTIEVYIPAKNSMSGKGYMTELQNDDGSPYRVLPSHDQSKLREDFAKAKKNYKNNARIVYVERVDVSSELAE